jgi:hypothetical protein
MPAHENEMTITQPTPEQINDMAQQMHREKSAVETSYHRCNAVPWNELGESYKVSLLRDAEKRLKETP